MRHLISFRLFEDNDMYFVDGHGRCNGNLYMYPRRLSTFVVKASIQKYIILLIFTAKLPEIYRLTYSGFKAGKTTLETGKKKKKKKWIY